MSYRLILVSPDKADNYCLLKLLNPTLSSLVPQSQDPIHNVSTENQKH